jgi:hypothetical protein
MNKQAELWTGPFGDAYHDRNPITDIDLKNRMMWWNSVIKILYMNCNNIPSSYLEVGAGQGANLQAIQKVYMTEVERSVDLYATEVNKKARRSLEEIIIPNKVKILDDIRGLQGIADCVFTYGVLIHTHPAHLKSLMHDMYHATKRWIICVEYFAPTTRPLIYHGEENALWLDDYGSHWIDNHKLRVIGHGFLWKRMSGLDNLTFWLLEKVQ